MKISGFPLPVAIVVAAVVLGVAITSARLIAQSDPDSDELEGISLPPTLAPGDAPGGADERKYPEIREENDRPDFEGELLGIYFANPSSLQDTARLPVPVSSTCLGGFEVVGDHDFAPPIPAYLPDGATQPATIRSSTGDDPNPAAIVCKETGEAIRASSGSDESGFQPSISLNSVVTWDKAFHEIDASTERVAVIQVSGRDVVSIAAVVAEIGSPLNQAELIVPTRYGYVLVKGIGVSGAELIGVCESLVPVIAGTSTQPE